MQDQLKIIFGGFIALLLAVVFIGVIATNEKAVTTLSNKVNESITLVGGHGAIPVNSRPATSLDFFGNASNNTITPSNTAMVIGTTINLSSNGSVDLSTQFAQNGVYNISYTYEGDSYVSNGTARSFISLNTVFFALFIVLIGVMVAMKVWPDLWK